MTRTQLLQELRQMRFKEAYGGWRERRLTQEEAARLLGLRERRHRRGRGRGNDVIDAAGVAATTSFPRRRESVSLNRTGDG